MKLMIYHYIPILDLPCIDDGTDMAENNNFFPVYLFWQADFLAKPQTHLFAKAFVDKKGARSWF